MGKGKIAHYEQFLLFSQCFQKVCFPEASKGVIVWESINPSSVGTNSLITVFVESVDQDQTAQKMQYCVTYSTQHNHEITMFQVFIPISIQSNKGLLKLLQQLKKSLFTSISPFLNLI